MTTVEEAMSVLGGRKVFGKRIVESAHAIPLIEEGLPYDSLIRVLEALDISRDRLSVILGIPKRTLARRKQQKKLAWEESDRLYRIARLVVKATAVLGTQEKSRAWLKEPNRALGNAVPLELAATDAGAIEIEKVLDRIHHGVFS